MLSQEGSCVSQEHTPHISYTEQFYNHFPFYLSIGMTYDQYWNDDPCLVRFYRKAYELQRDRKNYELWLQGMYVYEAIGEMAPILNAFSKERKPRPYSTEPYALTRQESEHRKKESEKNAYTKVKDKMASFAIQFNAKFNRKDG